MEANCDYLYSSTSAVATDSWHRFFDLFVAMCNHVDDIVDIT